MRHATTLHLFLSMSCIYVKALHHISSQITFMGPIGMNVSVKKKKANTTNRQYLTADQSSETQAKSTVGNHRYAYLNIHLSGCCDEQSFGSLAIRGGLIDNRLSAMSRTFNLS